MKDRLVDFCREYELFCLVRWLLFFSIVYAVFLTLLLSFDTMKVRLERVLQDNPLFSATVKQARWGVFPPGVQLDQLTLHLKCSASTPTILTLQQVRVSGELTGFFPPRPCIRIEVAGLGGTAQARVLPDALLQPTAFQIEAEWAGLALPSLLALVPDKKQATSDASAGIADMMQIHAGRLSGSLVGQFPRSRPLTGNGSLHMTLDGVDAALTLPFFRAETLKQVTGQTDLRWKGETVTLEKLVVRSSLVQGQMQGSLKVSPTRLTSSDMSLRASLTIAPEQLRLELLPPRTRAAFETSGQARVRISGTPSAPIFALE